MKGVFKHLSATLVTITVSLVECQMQKNLLLREWGQVVILHWHILAAAWQTKGLWFKKTSLNVENQKKC